MRTAMLLFILLCYTHKASAVSNATADTSRNYASYTRVILLKIAPVAALSKEFPLFVEVLLNRDWSVEFRGGLNHRLFLTLRDYYSFASTSKFKPKYRIPSLGYSVGVGLRRRLLNEFINPYAGSYIEFRMDYIKFNNKLNVQMFADARSNCLQESYTRVNGQFNFGQFFVIHKNLHAECSVGIGTTYAKMQGYQYSATGPLQILVDKNRWLLRPLLTSSFKLNFCLNCSSKQRD